MDSWRGRERERARQTDRERGGGRREGDRGYNRTDVNPRHNRKQK